jgi:hypothetical protein
VLAHDAPRLRARYRVLAALDQHDTLLAVDDHRPHAAVRESLPVRAVDVHDVALDVGVDLVLGDLDVLVAVAVLGGGVHGEDGDEHGAEHER